MSNAAIIIEIFWSSPLHCAVIFYLRQHFCCSLTFWSGAGPGGTSFSYLLPHYFHLFYAASSLVHKVSGDCTSDLWLPTPFLLAQCQMSTL